MTCLTLPVHLIKVDSLELVVAFRNTEIVRVVNGVSQISMLTSRSQANSRAQDLVDDVLTTPGSKVKPNSRGGVDVVAPDGRVIRYNRDGTMQGFRE